MEYIDFGGTGFCNRQNQGICTISRGTGVFRGLEMIPIAYILDRRGGGATRSGMSFQGYFSYFHHPASCTTDTVGAETQKSKDITTVQLSLRCSYLLGLTRTWAFW